MAQWQRIFLPSRRLRRRRFDPWVGKISWGRKIAAHSSILTWEIPWIEEPAGPQSWGRKESDMTEHAHTHMDRSGSLVETSLIKDFRVPSFPAHFAGKSASPAPCLANVLFFSYFFCILVWSVFNL